jgi:hypothetical protein
MPDLRTDVSQDALDIDRACRLLEHWVVLAVAVFITGCAKRNFSVLQLLREPVRLAGTIQGGVGTAEVPKWFPVQESVLEVGGGALYGKLRDLAVPSRTDGVNPQTVRLQIDFSRVSLPAGLTSFTLTYFPWFRFLSEPLNFDAAGRVADYVADCVRFLLVRNGATASVESDGETRRVRASGGLEIEITGTQALRSLALSHGPSRTLFDLTAKRIEVAQRMFPAAYAAGQELFNTPDRPLNVDMAIDSERLTLTAVEGAAHV